MNQNERRQFLIRYLLKENPRYSGTEIPEDDREQKELLRGLVNVRPPKPAQAKFLEIQDRYLSEETRKKCITDAAWIPEIQPGISLRQGDITTLRCDAIVNAANAGMTGCYVPNHRCIDNCIHTYAGVQLRLECDAIMKKQGRAEPTGQAKITQAYNLPCRYILHTVGPIISGAVTDEDNAMLASCYRSCLELAAEKGLETIAFCCISTGEFRFPKEQAAVIAVDTVRTFMHEKTSIQKVIFNVFKNEDRQIYERLLG